MVKSKQAFRTISEVSEWLDTPTHVLRFWESKFRQIKPVKRAGGRRYYRPKDMTLIGGIKALLHGRGLSIKDVQTKIKSDGVDAICALSKPLDFEATESLYEKPIEMPDETVTLFPKNKLAEARPTAPKQRTAPPTRGTNATLPPSQPDKDQMDLFMASRSEQQASKNKKAAAFMLEQSPNLEQLFGVSFRLKANQADLQPHHKALVTLLENHRI